MIDAIRTGLARAVLPGGMDVGWRVGGPGGTMAYDAARVSRRDADWIPTLLGPNAAAEQFGGLSRIRARARDLADNNELVDAAAWTVVDGIVGTGLDNLDPDTGVPWLNDQIRDVLSLTLHRVDPERTRSLGEHQQLVLREMTVAGEVGVLRTIAPPFRGFPSMPAIETVDADRIPLELSGQLENGNVVRQGVEYDQLGRIVAYHVLKHNPRDEQWMASGMGGVSFGSRDLVRLGVDAFDLLFVSRRVAQLRGVPTWVSVMKTLRTHDGLYDNTMLLAQLISSMGIVMDAPNAQMLQRKDGKTGEYGAVDTAGNPVSVIRGLMLMFKKPGTAAPQAISPNVPGPSFEPVNREGHQRASRGFGLRYDEFSGDYGRTTFASGRLGACDGHRKIERMREWLLERDTFRHTRLCTDWGVLTGAIELGKLTAEEHRLLGPMECKLYKLGIGLKGPPVVNPYQEAQAEATEIAAGTRSKIGVCSSKGLNFRQVIEEEAKYEAAENEIRAKYGLGPRQPAAAPGKNAAPGSPEDPNYNPDNADKQENGGEQPGANADGIDDDGVGLLARRRRRAAELNGTSNGVHHA
jgi:capsid protein